MPMRSSSTSAKRSREAKRGRRDDLQERSHALEHERAREAGGHRVPRFGAEALVEERLAQRALARAVIEQEELGAAIEPRDDRRVSAAGGVLAHLQVELGRQRLDEDLDGPATRQPDLPRFLVTEVQLEQARAILVEHVGGLFDDLGVDAASDRHRAEDATALADEHLGAFFSWGGAAGVDERGDGDATGSAT